MADSAGKTSPVSDTPKAIAANTVATAIGTRAFNIRKAP